MAKKKQTHQQKSAKMAVEQETHQSAETTPVTITEDNTAEKLSNLKSLNAMLVNETAKKRQEISALLDEKKSLEAELTRSESDAESVRSELTRVGEELRRVMEEKEGLRREMGEIVKEKVEIERNKCEGELEIEKLKEFGDELRSEIERKKESLGVVLCENKELEGVVEVKDEEVRELKRRLSELEGKERSLMEEFEGFRGKYEIVVKELRESEEKVEVMRIKYEGLKNVVEGSIREKEGVLRENEWLQKVKLELEGHISNLGEEVCGLNGVVLSLREDEEKWRVKVFELEKSNGGVVHELEWLKNEFRLLLEEKKENEREIEGMISEKLRNLERLGELEKEIECVKRVNEEVVGEKNMLEEVRLRQEDKIRELQYEVNEIRSNVLLIQESNKDQLENNMKLLSEINEYKSELNRVVMERDDVKRTLEEEKMNGAKLQVKVSEISKKMEETAKVIEELRGASDTLVTEKKELECNYSKLVEEKGFVETNYVKAKEKIAELEGSLKSKSDMFESVLSMLRNTSKKLCVENKDKDEEIAVNERGFDGEMTPYMTELEAIMAVFRSKEDKVGEMEIQMEKLHCSVVDAKRKKMFWTLFSSATTILAAVFSFAYATGVR